MSIEQSFRAIDTINMRAYGTFKTRNTIVVSTRVVNENAPTEFRLRDYTDNRMKNKNEIVCSITTSSAVLVHSWNVFDLLYSPLFWQSFGRRRVAVISPIYVTADSSGHTGVSVNIQNKNNSEVSIMRKKVLN